MNDGQVKQIVAAIREHTRAMVVLGLLHRAPKTVMVDGGFPTDITDEQAYAWAAQESDALLAALSASSGGEHGGAGIPGGGKPEHAAGPGDELTATPPLSADLVTARARIADLEEAARRYFNADGSVSLMVSAEAVVEARKADARRIAELEAQLGLKRMCVNCGKCKPAAEPQHEPLPECVGEDGLSACTFDTTPQEAWEYWRKRAHELEAQVREQREALKVARKAFNAMANEPIGPMDASDREVLQACEAVALDALAHPLIGGAK